MARILDRHEGMTDPRAVFPERSYMLTRRTTQRQFLLRPDDETNNAFVYCLAVAAARYDIVVMMSQMMSNHHHTALYDPLGKVNEFMQFFHAMTAHCVNLIRGRKENMWSSDAPSLVELIEAGDVFEKIVYVTANPVNADLVEEVEDWPGPKFFEALVERRSIVATRPAFFSKHGSMPERVELTLEIPEFLADRTSLVEALVARVDRIEASRAKTRAGRPVVGRTRILRQSWQGAPTTVEPRRRIRPRVAGLNLWARIDALQEKRDFVDTYRTTRIDWLADKPVLFPAGTYWLRRFAKAPVEPTPTFTRIPIH